MQKLKIIKELEILEKYTDSNHSIDSVSIISLLREQGIKCERKTLYDDMELLINAEYPIEVLRKDKNYYRIKEKFTSQELKLMFNSTQDKALKQKILSLASDNQKADIFENKLKKPSEEYMLVFGNQKNIDIKKRNNSNDKEL